MSRTLNIQANSSAIGSFNRKLHSYLCMFCATLASCVREGKRDVHGTFQSTDDIFNRCRVSRGDGRLGFRRAQSTLWRNAIHKTRPCASPVQEVAHYTVGTRGTTRALEYAAMSIATSALISAAIAAFIAFSQPPTLPGEHPQYARGARVAGFALLTWLLFMLLSPALSKP